MKKALFLLASVLLLAGCRGNAELQAPTDSPDEPDTSGEAGKLEENVEYRQAKVDGLTHIRLEQGKGITLDLNGDGAEEQLYLSAEGVYINGILEAELWKNAGGKMDSRPWDGLWLVDIDPSDVYVNFIVAGEAEHEEILMWYDGSLKSARMENFDGHPFSEAEYYGDGAFLVNSMLVPLLYESCYKAVEYRWGAAEGVEYTGKAITISEGFGNREDLENPADGQWNLLADLKLFSDCSLNAESWEAEGQQKISPLQAVYKESDAGFDYCWILLETESGEQGWIYTEYADGQWRINKDRNASDVIGGFSTAG